MWTPSHGRTKVGRLAITYLQQLCAKTGGCLEDLGERWTIEMGVEGGSGKSELAA